MSNSPAGTSVTVRVKPNARQSSVTRIDERTYRVAVCAPALDGRANHAMLKALAAEFDVPISSLVLVKGLRSRVKVVQLNAGYIGTASSKKNLTVFQ